MKEIFKNHIIHSSTRFKKIKPCVPLPEGGSHHFQYEGEIRECLGGYTVAHREVYLSVPGEGESRPKSTCTKHLPVGAENLLVD